MPVRRFCYGSPELWNRVQEILARPDRMTKPLRQGLAWSTSGLGETALFRWPVHELMWSRSEGYSVLKGSRADALLTDNIHRAINTGRTDLEEVQELLVEMFGEQARHAWDEPWRVLDEAVSKYGGKLSRKEAKNAAQRTD